MTADENMKIIESAHEKSLKKEQLEEDKSKVVKEHLKNKNASGVCSFRWNLAVFHRAGFHTSIVIQWENQSRHARICTLTSKTSTPQQEVEEVEVVVKKLLIIQNYKCPNLLQRYDGFNTNYCKYEIYFKSCGMSC